MKTIIVTALLFCSVSGFAREVNFSELNCVVNSSHATNAQKSFRMKLTFESEVSAVNGSGLDKVQNADLTITYALEKDEVKTVTVNNVSLRQATESYGFELSFRKYLLDSEYYSFMVLTPEFSGFLNKSLKSYNGALELNGLVNEYDALILKTEYLVCNPK